MLFSVVVGAEHASPVLLLHGGGLSHRQWTPQLQGLPHLRLIAPDLPEHGRSREAGPFTLDGAARQVLAVLDQHVPGERVAVVGSSLGGAVALQLLRLAPERFTRLLVTGSAAGLSPLAGRLMLSSISVLRWFQEERLVRQALRQFHIPEAYQDVVREDLRLALNSATQRHLTQALLALRLPMGMDLPVLALVGARETFLARRAAQVIAQSFPRGRFAVVPHVGHVWNLEVPELFGQTLSAWLQDGPLPWESRLDSGKQTRGL